MIKKLMVLAVITVFVATVSANATEAKQPVDSTQLMIDSAIKNARLALNKYGTTDSAMMVMQAELTKLAQIPGIRTRGKMVELHGSKSMGRALIGSEGDSGICVYVSWFGKGAQTPVHDHLTWGVVHVLSGKDRYIQWKRVDNPNPDSSKVEKFGEKILNAGESVYWMNPPLDLHSQESVDEEIYELVMVGHDLGADYVTTHQSKYDIKTGKMISKIPK